MVRVEDTEFARTSGKTHHATLRPTQSDAARVEGTAFEVTDEDLTRADAYEPEGYTRVAAELASGRLAWLYVDAETATAL